MQQISVSASIRTAFRQFPSEVAMIKFLLITSAIVAAASAACCNTVLVDSPGAMSVVAPGLTGLYESWSPGEPGTGTNNYKLQGDEYYLWYNAETEVSTVHLIMLLMRGVVALWLERKTLIHEVMSGLRRQCFPKLGSWMTVPPA